MATPLRTSRGPSPEPVDTFAPHSDRRGSVWLDSSLTHQESGGRSLQTTDPIAELVLHGHRGRLIRAGRETDCHYDDLLRELEAIRVASDRWAVGFIGYEATLPRLRVHRYRAPELPDLHFFVYDHALVYDHQFGIFSDPGLASHLSRGVASRKQSGIDEARGAGKLQPTISRDEYLERVGQIRRHIYEGDIYQANFTSRFDCSATLEPFAAYLRLRRLNPCRYGAYLNFGDYQILSSSPERMFRWADGVITSSPIKGTIARGHDDRETERNLQTLLHSAKDRAELLMIVDLVRNDLGKIAQVGSVQVENLNRPEVHSSLIHLVADVSARPVAGCTLAEVIAALLPGGSITGAPKKRAVEILQAIETTPRSVYTGCIGYVGGGVAEFNIAIRTMMYQNGCYRIHAGGGIVADSDPAAEYEEMLLKARNLFHSLGLRS